MSSNNQQLRMAAHAQGEKTYSTGKACKYGHMARRYVVNGGCVECTNGLRLPSKIAQDLQPWQPLPLQVPTGLDVATLDGINDYLHQCMLSWMEQTHTLTQGRKDAYARLLQSRINARALRAYQNAAPVPVAPAVSPLLAQRRAKAQQFILDLATKTGAALDHATSLIRGEGEPDVLFRERIKAETLRQAER